MSYVAGKELTRGKTKVVCATNQEDVVVLRNLANITANDDPNVTKQFKAKAIAATTTTCRVFELLRAAGVPVAYIEQVLPTSFAAHRCTMVPLEAVARRYAVGSYLKRHPEMAETSPPYRFACLETELFLKTTNGHCVLSDGQDHNLELDPSKGQEDPLLVAAGDRWLLRHAKKPAWQDDAVLGTLDPSLLQYDTATINRLLRRVFLVLEGAWATLGWRLVDLKIEVGITADGQLVVADVIDNDSWRLRDPDWQEMSKQVFRDQIAYGAVDLDDIAWRYKHVAGLTSQFRIPRQAVVLWLGSSSDEPKVMGDLKKTIGKITAGAEVIKIVLSGHRQSQSVLQAISLIESDYPEGGVIIACVGLSNGLGPVVSAHTHWPVINLPLTPEDVMSSLRLPGRVPATTALNLSNAVHQAMQILGQRNPVAYAMARELAEADTGLPVGTTITDIAPPVSLARE
jgi:phosphoribosylaminoimidazole carboxylase/phosphoribosylaminoimidazole-succinocarboxamide synthase